MLLSVPLKNRFITLWMITFASMRGKYCYCLVTRKHLSITILAKSNSYKLLCVACQGFIFPMKTLLAVDLAFTFFWSSCIACAWIVILIYLPNFHPTSWSYFTFVGWGNRRNGEWCCWFSSWLWGYRGGNRRRGRQSSCGNSRRNHVAAPRRR